MKPYIAVIIPLFNRVDLVKETLHSLQAQTFQYWEAIVVDDGSTDGSYELVQQLAQQDHRIKLLRRQREPKGAPTCRNIGAHHAQSDYLIFLDSDDILAPFCLQQRAGALAQNPGFDFLVFSMLLFNHKAGDTNTLWNIATTEDDLSRFLRTDAPWQTSCPVFQRHFFLQAGGFDEALPYWQDYELHTRLLIKGATYKKMMQLPPDCYYRKHDKTISQQRVASPKRLELMTRVYKELCIMLEAQGALNKHHLKQIRSMFFKLSVNQVLDFKNIYRGLEVWSFCYTKKWENEYRYTIGYWALSMYFLKLTLRKNSALFSIIAKLLLRILPKNYRIAKVEIGKHSQA
uniref:Glycosyltransferase family A protein n=1 Tax=Roseihalotalea indica TaxID=2867963 RepID=A0AA49JJX6_9BACT|nr:glycosyltransferase family A protein [Tunicatimonas sp. TK19036]